jgi:tetratricopeptide (TPR) repeat protein
MEALQAAIKAAPSQPAGYIESAAAQVRAGQADRAIATLNDGMAAGAPREPLLTTRAAIEDQSGKKDSAIATYREILKINPRSIVAANNYASLVADVKPQDKALLTEALDPIQKFADSRNPSILDTIAWLNYRLGSYQSAKDLLVRANADKSANAQLRFHYGAVLIALGDKEAGRTMVKATLNQTFPGREEAEQLMTE